MVLHCPADKPVDSFHEKNAYPALSEKNRNILKESNAILDKCRARAGMRTRNKMALILPRKGGRPSFGLLYIGAYLLDNYFEVRIFEFLDELYPPNTQYNRHIWRKLFEFNPDFIGCNVISSTAKIVQGLIAQIKNKIPDIVIICGGKHATSNPEDLLSHNADYCAIGEAEVTIVELLDALNFNESIDEVTGIAYLKNGAICRTGNRSVLPLDYLLRPAFELIDYAKYVNYRFQGIPGHYLRTGFIFGSRGCPYRCKFCTTQSREYYRERSIDDLIDEMESQIEKYGVDGFAILDDLFYFREERTAEFCKKIVKRGIKAKFFCHVRVDRVTRETVELMKKAGFLLLAVGVESGSQKLLDAMNKETSVEKIENAFKIYNEIGINTFAFIIVGHPDETDNDRELTKQLLKRIKPTHVPVSYYVPMPGTPSHDFETDQAKYLLGGVNFQGFSYLTDDPEFSTTIPLEELKKIGNDFERLSVINRNMNLFKYPAFILFITGFLIIHPLIIIEALYIRYISKKTHKMSLISVLKDAIQFQKQKF